MLFICWFLPSFDSLLEHGGEMDVKLDGIRQCFWHVITPRAKRSNPYANAYQVRGIHVYQS
jgi:hypothetical protein